MTQNVKEWEERGLLQKYIKEKPKKWNYLLYYDRAGQGFRLSMRNLLIFFSTRNTKKKNGLEALEFHPRRPPISTFIHTYKFIVRDENMREVLVRAMWHFIFQIWLSLREFWTAGNTGRSLTVLGCCAVCRATAARSNLDGPLFQTHNEEEAASWVWMARVVSKRERVIRWAVKTWNPQNNE